MSALISGVGACSEAMSLLRLGHKEVQALTAFLQDACLGDPAMLCGSPSCVERPGEGCPTFSQVKVFADPTRHVSELVLTWFWPQHLRLPAEAPDTGKQKQDIPSMS